MAVSRSQRGPLQQRPPSASSGAPDTQSLWLPGSKGHFTQSVLLMALLASLERHEVWSSAWGLALIAFAVWREAAPLGTSFVVLSHRTTFCGLLWSPGNCLSSPRGDPPPPAPPQELIKSCGQKYLCLSPYQRESHAWLVPVTPEAGWSQGCQGGSSCHCATF